MYLGIDLGTSGVKVVVLSYEGKIVASENATLTVSRPQPLWSEQSPQDWWDATCTCIEALKKQLDLNQIEAIGLSGQMHGATLLDADNHVLRPAILWNDGRCEAECKALEMQVPESRHITGNLMMPGFTAPKLKWVAHHEPECFAKINKVLLPKDYLRFKMTGDYATDMSDAAGTLWLDVNQRDWSDPLLFATGLTRQHMPKLYEGTDITGTLDATIAHQWGMRCVPVVAGGGDNAAGAVGVSITTPGQAMLSLGTSGVYFVVTNGFVSNPESALHSFCHALPETWHSMSVILSAASCLDWVANLVGFVNVEGGVNVGEMMNQLAQYEPTANAVIFLPYLSGERTPHNNPHAKGVFWGMTHTTSKLDLAQAVLEGVGYALADGVDALHATGNIPQEICLIGGGAQSAYWRQMLADILEIPLLYRSGGEVGPALGAARLAALGIHGIDHINTICPEPALIQRHDPIENRRAYHQKQRKTFRALYQQLEPLFKQQ